jgi:putative FmdB family regulatory protein
MPIYEYRCSACGFEKDALQKMSDPPLVVCPNCGQSTLVKLVSAAGFQLKGSGWYATDFKSSGSKPAGDKGRTKSDGGAKDGGDTRSSDGKSDAKTGSDATSSTSAASASSAKGTPTAGAGD